MHTEVLLGHTVACTADMGKVVQPAVSDTVKSEREMTIKLSMGFHLPNEHLTELILYCGIMFLKSSMRNQTPQATMDSGSTIGCFVLSLGCICRKFSLKPA